MAQSVPAADARKTAALRGRDVTSVVEGASSLIINTSGQLPLAPPAVRFYPGDNGESVMVADFVGVNFGQTSRVLYPTGAGVQKVRLAQVQNRPAIFRLVLSASSMRVFKKVEFSSSPSGTLVVKLPAAGDTGNAGVSRPAARPPISSAMPSPATAPAYIPKPASSAMPMSNATAAISPAARRSNLPPMPAGGLLLDLQVDGQSVPAVAPPVVSSGRPAAVSSKPGPAADPNKPVLRGPIVTDVAAPAAAPPISHKAADTAAVKTPAATPTPKPPKVEKPRLQTEVVEIVAEEEPPMLPGLSSVKKIVQITSAAKGPQPAPDRRAGGSFTATQPGGTARGANQLTKAFVGSAGKSDNLPPPPPPSVALAGQEKVISEDDAATLAEQAPDIISACEVKVVSTAPLRFSVSSSAGKVLKTKSFRLHDPERHVIDIENASEIAGATMPEIPENAFVKTVRLGSPDGLSGRIVLDLNGEETQVCERCDENGLLIIDVAKEVPLPFNPVAHLPAGSVIVVDAGHGGTDPGAQRGDIQEKEITLAICEKLRKILRRQGAKVVMTRSDDTFVSLEERVRITNETAPNAFVSVHINSLESNNSITGIETYYLHPQSKSLAESIHSSLVGKLAVPDRNVRTARFYVVNHTPYPAILAEVGFISNKDERDKLISFDYQQKIAEALAQGVIVYVATHGATPGASIASATAAGMSSVKQAARSSQAADASGTRTAQRPSQSKKAKRFTQILQAKKPAKREKSSKIAISRGKAKKSTKRIAIAHRSLRSNRSR